jgi:hypothetical protein
VKVRWVGQKHDKGCVIACIAMVLGWEYEDVVSEFKNDFDKKGTSTDFAKEFICDHGFSVIEKRGTGYIDLRAHNKRMLQPFAPVHIVSVRQFIDLPKHTHAYVTDAKGRVFEPISKDRKEVLFYSVEHVMGFFKT